ncbi:hypothetical protein [Nonomuraea sp. SYSU D8015]|uniref:hypothetical protein n=1 Tax=Nonomuraea sp. SYSU D8015 TaxID=2593644 RepID=UPI001660CC64|nr:hypothetical protein [Nonomuraea sp. SYSU D8015]
MTELAIPNRPATSSLVAVDPQPSPLMVWAMEVQQASQIAEALAQTSFVPAAMRGKPHEITAAILAGAELGLPPVASLRSMDVIQGTPALRAHAMRGLVQSHGHTVQLVESTKDRCVMRGRRKGETEWQQVEWDIPRAEQLGLTGKSEWKKQPKTMLVARATGEICRLIAADVLYAMPYAAEELGDPDLAPPPASDSRVTAEEILRRQQPAPPNSATTERMISEPQQKKMAALMRTVGLTDRDSALAFVNEVLQRGDDNQVTSRNELTLDEASKVIDALDREAGKNNETADGDAGQQGEASS